MGASVRPQTIEEALAEIRKEQSAAPATPAKDINAALQEIRAEPDTAQGMTDLLHETGIMGGKAEEPIRPATRPDVARALPRNRRNPTGDIQAATANPLEQGKFIARGLTANALSAAQALPPVEMIEARLMQAGSHLPWSEKMTYPEALATLRNQTERIPKPIRIAEQVAFGGRYLPTEITHKGNPIVQLPSLKNPAIAGGVLGAGHGALAADPDMTLGQRAGAGILGGGIGYLGGKYLDKGTTAVRSAFAKNPAKNYLERELDRAASAKRLYDIAEAQGHLNKATPAIQAYLAEPDIAQRVAALQHLDQFKALSPDDPKMLDAVYKSLSDEWTSINKGLSVPEPGKPNTGRFKLQDIRGKQKRLVGAMGTPGPNAPAGMMPSYEDAVADFAKKSGEIDAMFKGMRVSQAEGGPARPSPEQIKSVEPETGPTYAEWLKTATPGERKAASQGILGDVSNAIKTPGKYSRQILPKKAFRMAATAAGPLLRATKTPEQELIDLFQKYTLLGARSATDK